MIVYPKMAEPNTSFKDSELYGILKPLLTLMRCIGGPLYWKHELCWNAKRYLRELYTILVELLVIITILRIVISAGIHSQDQDLIHVLSIATMIVMGMAGLFQSIHSCVAWRKILPFFEEYARVQSIQLSDCRLLRLAKYFPIILSVWIVIVLSGGIILHAVLDELRINLDILSYPWTTPHVISIVTYALTVCTIIPSLIHSYSFLVIIATASYLIFKELTNICQNIEESLNDYSTFISKLEPWRQKYCKLGHITSTVDDIGLLYNGSNVLQFVVRK